MVSLSKPTKRVNIPSAWLSLYQCQQAGHKFCNADGKSYKGMGYYPTQNEDANKMETFEFTRDFPSITFYDTTLVPIVGRVTGGAEENEKPLGLGQSVNNMVRLH